jgi:Ser/Thr protein kinase RdoA (MazF antagonist)
VPPAAVIEAYALEPASIEPLSGGLINASYSARQLNGTPVVLQRVNPIFPPGVHDDIESVTRHLAARGVATPRLVPARCGDLYHNVDGHIWRLLTRIEGESHESITGTDMAREAGRVLGLFHATLADFATPLVAERPGVHDIERHVEHLRRTLAAHKPHPAYAAVAALGERVLEFVTTLPPLPELPARLVHGDPKISNVIFAGAEAVCLGDLDTITRAPVALELGDALRSWCNLAAEDSPDARFSLELYRAALTGYRLAAAPVLDRVTRDALPAATILIAVELAARFAADALNESYFSWDRKRFTSASAHNLARADAQLKLAASMFEALPAMRELAVTEP